MKNIFKLFSVMAIAASLLAASCGGDENTFKIKVKANNSDWGTVTGGGEYEDGATATLTATANAGYTFVNWEDGTTNNPRLVTVTGDAEYTANFAEQAGVTVAFGSSTWNATYINGQCNSQAFMVAAAPSETEEYPYAVLGVMNSAPAVGTFTGDAVVNDDGTAQRGNVYMHYYQSAERAMQLGEGNPTGDWWAKELTVNVSSFDAATLAISLVANATMGDLYALTQGSSWGNTNTESMTMTIANVNLTQVKGIMDSAKNGKIARR